MGNIFKGEKRSTLRHTPPPSYLCSNYNSTIFQKKNLLLFGIGPRPPGGKSKEKSRCLFRKSITSFKVYKNWLRIYMKQSYSYIIMRLISISQFFYYKCDKWRKINALLEECEWRADVETIFDSYGTSWFTIQWGWQYIFPKCVKSENMKKMRPSDIFKLDADILED